MMPEHIDISDRFSNQVILTPLFHKCWWAMLIVIRNCVHNDVNILSILSNILSQKLGLKKMRWSRSRWWKWQGRQISSSNFCVPDFKPIAYDYIMQVYTLILEGKTLLDLVPKSQKSNLCNCALTSYLLIRYLQPPFFSLCICISHLLLIHS